MRSRRIKGSAGNCSLVQRFLTQSELTDRNRLEGLRAVALTKLTALYYLISMDDRVHCLIALHICTSGEVMVTMGFTEGGVASVGVGGVAEHGLCHPV